MITSLISVIGGKKVKFIVTPKEKMSNAVNLQHVVPHLVLTGAAITGIVYNSILIALHQHPSPSGFAANAFWCVFNIISLSVMIRAAFYEPLPVHQTAFRGSEQHAGHEQEQVHESRYEAI